MASGGTGWSVPGGRAPQGTGEDTEWPAAASGRGQVRLARERLLKGQAREELSDLSNPGAALQHAGEEFQGSGPREKVKSGHGTESTGGGSPT